MDGERERDVFVELRNFGGFDGWDSLVERNARQVDGLDDRDAAAIDVLEELPNMVVADVFVEVVEQDDVLVQDGGCRWTFDRCDVVSDSSSGFDAQRANGSDTCRCADSDEVIAIATTATTRIPRRVCDDDLDCSGFAISSRNVSVSGQPIIETNITMQERARQWSQIRTQFIWGKRLLHVEDLI